MEMEYYIIHKVTFPCGSIVDRRLYLAARFPNLTAVKPAAWICLHRSRGGPAGFSVSAACLRSSFFPALRKRYVHVRSAGSLRCGRRAMFTPHRENVANVSSRMHTLFDVTYRMHLWGSAPSVNLGVRILWEDPPHVESLKWRPTVRRLIP